MCFRDQIQLGNRNCEKMINRINSHIKRNTHLFAKEIVDLYFACYGSTWEMVPDLGDEA